MLGEGIVKAEGLGSARLIEATNRYVPQFIRGNGLQKAMKLYFAPAFGRLVDANDPADALQNLYRFTLQSKAFLKQSEEGTDLANKLLNNAIDAYGKGGDIGASLNKVVSDWLEGDFRKVLIDSGVKESVAKAATKITNKFFFEGASETAAQEVNNVLDTRFGINRFTDKNGNFDGRALLERSFDTFLVSSLIGGGTTVAGGVAGRQRELMYERLTPTKAKDLYSKIGKYAQTLQSENESQQSSGPVFEENVKNIEELEQELQNVRKRVKTVYDTYSNPEFAEMVQLGQRVFVLVESVV